MAKLRGGFGKLRGDFRLWGRWVVCVVWLCVLCSCFLSFLPFLPFPHSCVFSAFVGVEELKRGDVLRFVYIFRFGFGGQTKTERRAVGGSSDGGVKGKPLNKPLMTSVSRLSFC